MSPEHGKLCAEYLFLRNIFFFLFSGKPHVSQTIFHPCLSGYLRARSSLDVFIASGVEKEILLFFLLVFISGGKWAGK